MSLHRSLKTKPSALNQHRNVLTRAERIVRLTESEKFDPEKESPFGLAKVANRQVATKKPKKDAVEGEAGAEGDAAPAATAEAAKGTAGKAPAGKGPAGKTPAGKSKS